eukprot:TRINITY_DN3189_c0_g1_i4.p1 TRINITY_DN3189_c0_g1~~TRINITY_DN3189_c0_g1_i4.p1  ORF type:complete len:649 (+),score=102.69 TRINITY_DN3189_c0_g1_i4:39-1985(+)
MESRCDIPVKKVGLVIGKKGATVNSLMEEFGVKIRISNGQAIVYGSRSEDAVDHIKKMVSTAPPRYEDLQPTFSCGADKKCILLRPSEAQTMEIKQCWKETGGDPNDIIGSWQICNNELKKKFRETEALPGDLIQAWHGTGNANIAPICCNGFDPNKRERGLYGDGDYFASDPKVAKFYCKSGSFVLLCNLHFLENEKQQKWIEEKGYYVMNMNTNEGTVRMQALPVQLVQIKEFDPKTPEEKELHQALERTKEGISQRGVLQSLQWGAQKPNVIHKDDAPLPNENITHMHFGWLNPQYSHEKLIKSVQDHFRRHNLSMEEIIVDHNGLRQGVFIKLSKEITPSTFATLRELRYEGHKVSLLNFIPRPISTTCPKLRKGYCRGWNLRGHHDWTAACWYEHPPEIIFPTCGYTRKILSEPAKLSAIVKQLKESVPNATDIVVESIVNEDLNRRYSDWKKYLQQKHPHMQELELWHGTSKEVLDSILTRGFQPPSDTNASPDCPNFIPGTSTTHCSNHCSYCVEPHNHNMCHMYGLGVYFADSAKKSQRYCKSEGRYSQLLCTVNLGSPCLIRGNLIKQDAMHHLSSCVCPEDYLDRVVQPYNQTTRHETYHVDGLGMKGHRAGLSVINSEYVIFAPSHAVAKYVVTYSA